MPCGQDCDQVQAIEGWYSLRDANHVLQWFRQSTAFEELKGVPYSILPVATIAFRCKTCRKTWAWYLADGPSPGGVMRYESLDSWDSSGQTPQ